MKKKIAILTMLSTLFISTTAFASSGYMGQSLSLSGTNSASSSTGYNNTQSARVDVSNISDTGGCTKVKVFVMNTGDGSITTAQVFQKQNTRMFSVSKGNIKAVFKRNTTAAGTMNVSYNFIYNY